MKQLIQRLTVGQAAEHASSWLSQAMTRGDEFGANNYHNVKAR